MSELAAFSLPDTLAVRPRRLISVSTGWSLYDYRLMEVLNTRQGKTTSDSPTRKDTRHRRRVIDALNEVYHAFTKEGAATRGTLEMKPAATAADGDVAHNSPLFLVSLSS